MQYYLPRLCGHFCLGQQSYYCFLSPLYQCSIIYLGYVATSVSNSNLTTVPSPPFTNAVLFTSAMWPLLSRTAILLLFSLPLLPTQYYLPRPCGHFCLKQQSYYCSLSPLYQCSIIYLGYVATSVSNSNLTTVLSPPFTNVVLFTSAMWPLSNV